MPEESGEKKVGMLEAIIELKELEPFEPFEIVLSSGDKFLIDWGANLVEMSDRFFYAVRGTDDWAWIRFNQIVAVKGHVPKKKHTRRKAS
jgi:hypothetical protein